MSGKYYDELRVGDRFFHPAKGSARKISKEENLKFCKDWGNNQILHYDDEFARQLGFEGAIVNSLLTLTVVVNLTVDDLTDGTIVGNLSYDRIIHRRPVYGGDSLTVETIITDKKESKSKRGCGIIKLTHIGRNQDGNIVIEIDRTIMFLKRESFPVSEQIAIFS